MSDTNDTVSATDRAKLRAECLSLARFSCGLSENPAAEQVIETARQLFAFVVEEVDAPTEA